MTDIRQSPEYAQYLRLQGWTVKRINNTNYFIKKLPLIGSLLKVQRPKEINFQEIDKLRKKYHVFQTIIEPDSTITGASTHTSILDRGYKLSKSPYLPSCTLQIDLAQPLKKITANFKKDTREIIGRGQPINVKEYSSPSDINKFHDAWKKSVKFTRYVPSLSSLINLRKAFTIHKPIILASHNKNNEIISGAVFTRSGRDFSYYWYGFTNYEGRTSLAQYSLIYQGILWAKRMSCRVFDFEGVFDPRFPNKSWLGFTHFKKSFGGCEVLYPGCYTKFRFPSG